MGRRFPICFNRIAVSQWYRMALPLLDVSEENAAELELGSCEINCDRVK